MVTPDSVEQLRRLGHVELDPVRVVGIRDHRNLDELDVLPRDPADAPGDRDNSSGGKPRIGRERVRLGDVIDDWRGLGDAVQDAGLEYLLHQADHQQLVALDALQVRAEAEVFSQPPELERLQALEHVASGLEAELVKAGRMDRGWQADRNTTDGVAHASEAAEVDRDKVVEVDARRMLDGLPQAVGSAVGEARVELLDARL